MCIMLQCDHTARCSAVLMFNWVVLLFRSWQKLTIALLFLLDRVDCNLQIVNMQKFWKLSAYAIFLSYSSKFWNFRLKLFLYSIFISKKCVVLLLSSLCLVDAYPVPEKNDEVMCQFSKLSVSACLSGSTVSHCLW